MRWTRGQREIYDASHQNQSHAVDYVCGHLLNHTHQSAVTMALAKEDSNGHVSSQENSEVKEAKPSGFKCYIVRCSLKATCAIAFTDRGYSVSSHTRTTLAGCSTPSQPWPPLQQALPCR